jgi:hypothetical protein
MSPLTCGFSLDEGNHLHLSTLDPPLHAQELALIHPLTHSLSPGAKGVLRAQGG